MGRTKGDGQDAEPAEEGRRRRGHLRLLETLWERQGLRVPGDAAVRGPVEDELRVNGRGPARHPADLTIAARDATQAIATGRSAAEGVVRQEVVVGDPCPRRAAIRGSINAQAFITYLTPEHNARRGAGVTAPLHKHRREQTGSGRDEVRAATVPPETLSSHYAAPTLCSAIWALARIGGSGLDDVSTKMHTRISDRKICCRRTRAYPLTISRFQYPRPRWCRGLTERHSTSRAC